ncbi:MAG TPA: hypothetical protein VLM85_24295 [Polyangiaceae bacterium]|nr:hypothetical protein [Polyangiaceae bacterium]
MTSPNSSAALLFALDGDDLDMDTQLDAAPLYGMPDDLALPTPREESFVGTLPREAAESVVEAVRHRHEALALAIGDVEQVCASFDSVDVSASAAQGSLRRRVGSLSMLCGALGDVAVLVEQPEHEALFAGDGRLAPYLAGVYLWAGDVTETLATLARDLNALSPNWSAFRERLDDVAWIYEMAMAEQSRLDRIVDAMSVPVRDALDELFIAFVGFKHKLDEPFG